MVEDSEMSTEYGQMGAQPQISIQKPNTTSRSQLCKSTLGGKRNIIPMLEHKN